MTVKRLALLAPLTILVAGGCYFFPKEEKIPVPPILAPAEVTYDEVVAARGTVEDKVVANGTVTLVDETPVYFRLTGGRLLALHVRTGDVVKAGALIAELDSGSLASRIEQQRLLVRKAEIVVERTALLGQDRFDREIASIDLELARIQLRDLQADLERTRITTPVAGTVIYVASAREGDVVAAYQTIAEIADPTRLQVLYRGESVDEFRAGMRVTVRLGETDRSGEVLVAPSSTPPDAPEEMRRAVVVGVTNLPAATKRGDSATITLVRARRENVIVLPRTVVKSYLGRSYVQVLVDGVKRERTVELGITGGTDVEILSGLEAGDRVLWQ